MAEDFQFADNHRDLCIPSGTGAGFQFEFYCQCCNDTWRSPFEAFRSGQVSGWLSQAQGVLGSLFGNTGYALGRAAAGMAEAGWGEGRDEAFRAAIEQAKPLFHRCAKCTQVVCARCWNIESGLCRNCAPIEAAEVQAARTRGHVEAAAEAAYKLGQQRVGPRVAVDAKMQLVCPACGTETRGASFCSQCGQALAVQVDCPACQAVIPSGARFCPAFGQALTRS